MKLQRAELRRQKTDAVAREDYVEAGRLKKQEASMDLEARRAELRRQMLNAVAHEDYVEAGRLKREVAALPPIGSAGALPA